MNLVKNIIISAMASNGVIGDGNEIPWRRNKEDIVRYKWDMDNFSRTTAMAPIIMGMNTAISLRYPLKNRFNIVICNIDRAIDLPIECFSVFNTDEKVKVLDPFEYMKVNDEKENRKFLLVDDIEQAIRVVNLVNEFHNYQFDKCYIIGGAKTYKKAFELGVVSNIILTCFDDEYDGDVYFPNEILDNFSIYSEEDYRIGNIIYYESKDAENEINDRISKIVLSNQFSNQ